MLFDRDCMKEQSKALLYVGIAVAGWSTVATAFKIGLRHFSYYELLLVAALTALLVFSLTLTVQKKWHLLRQLRKKEWLIFAITGLLNPAAYYLVLFKSYELLPAQIAQSINYAWAIVLTLEIAVFTRQRIPGVKFIGMFISLAGVALISLGAQSFSGVTVSVAGLLLAFFSAFIWATFWLLNQQNRRIDNVVALFTSFLFGSVFLLIGAPFVGVSLASFKGLLSGMYAGLFEMAIPFIFFGLALKKTNNPSLINQLCYFSPFISLFIIRAVLREQILPSTYLGLLLIIGGILFNEYIAGKRSTHSKK